jgi:hypothetical protein
MIKLMLLRKAAKEENQNGEKPIKTEAVKDPLTFRGLIQINIYFGSFINGAKVVRGGG